MVIAITFILSGFVKAIDPLGTQYKIGDYLEAWGMGSYAWPMLTLALSVASSAVEFLLGISMLFAIRRRLTSKLTLAVMALFTPLTLYCRTRERLRVLRRCYRADRLAELRQKYYPAGMRHSNMPMAHRHGAVRKKV